MGLPSGMTAAPCMFVTHMVYVVVFRKGRGFDSHVRQHSFLEFGHEIISMDILSIPLVQEGQWSVTGEKWALSTGHKTA